jgi:ketosteroid isomerase-like protein
MSEENVEIVRRAFEVWNTGDMDALRELYDPGIIWRGPEGWPEPGPYAGREAVKAQVEQMRETWDTDSFELISELIDVGDRVAVRFIWRGAGHGPEANIEATGVYTVRKGRIVYQEFFDVGGERGGRAAGLRGGQRSLGSTP